MASKSHQDSCSNFVPNSVYDSRTAIVKPEEDRVTKEDYRPTSLVHVDGSAIMSTLILVKQIETLFVKNYHDCPDRCGAQWDGGHSTKQKVAGSIPGQSTCLSCAFGPPLGRI